ncbi:uncharacterized protein TRIADDRAFT_60260 [Trichoplax adhaerens]|uniref:Coronin n=1 Tax=Trichoplax adhaerens TaxID=10228 RepID=B3S7R1_TRIAD|nr:hypothetical protein TRIADDRAFT_60260 [Trichoplax adhaerens]EDV21240.1 hypothetical protein TRIADDRAFT_60260 [Trichoplax adhaerens]|eukprot:XP_002116207.1 hypothetical protein TRIADDRAFT_60260 [Trichoplax adhaerens]
MLGQFSIRHSKFRHVYGQPYRRDLCYDSIHVAKNAFDSSYCAVNGKFIAVILSSGGGGSFLVLQKEKTGRVGIKCPRVVGHRGPVLDIAWNPFNENIIASCSEDHSIRIWFIPDDGIPLKIKKQDDEEERVEELDESVIILNGHSRRVNMVVWHPTANNVLASSSYDLSVVIWNVAQGSILNRIDCHKLPIFCIAFNNDGSLLASTSKDKKLRVIDPKTSEVKNEGICHFGLKGARVIFAGKFNKIITTGFSKHSERQFAVWDPDNLKDPIKLEGIDSGTGILFPFYDQDRNILYLAGKGDGNIRFYELFDQKPYCYFLNQFKSPSPHQGLTCLPNRYLDVPKCEIFRFYKLHSQGYLEPVSMIAPRKYDSIQTDLYPLTNAGIPSMEAMEWFEGASKPPVLKSITEDAIAEYRSRAKSITKMASAVNKNNALLEEEAKKRGLENMTKEQLIIAYKLLQQELENVKKELALKNQEIKKLKEKS